MKKLVVSFLTAILFSGAASAADYRGFAEIGVGSTAHKELNYGHSLTSFTMEFSTVHGAQLNRHIFVGGGVDVAVFSTTNLYYNNTVNLNVFGDFRYDMNIAKTWSPFVNLKLGYRALPATIDANLLTEDGERIGYGFEGQVKYAPLYINPSIGVRLRLSSKCGLNFSVGYTPMRFKKTDGFEGTYYDYGLSQEIPYKNAHIDIKNGQLFTFNVGIDF